MEIPDFLQNYPWLFAAFIIISRILDVSLGTVRTICVVRGYRTIAALLGFCEVMVWIIAVAGVLAEPTLLTIMAYGVGFALGNICGVWLEGKMALGHQMLILLSKSRSHTIAFGLRMAGHTVTEVTATGRDGEIDMAFVVVPRRQSQEIIDLARGLDHEIFITIQDVRSTPLQRKYESIQPTGWRSVLKKK
ncbi:MAG: DUF2179 domain-containing protein [Phycisphaeraceae bacterium]|nr:DUF2179 domain-containing protein [Phycisphaeraceae bacterium]